MSDALIIRQASSTEFATAINWAASEGWNPGIADLDAFYAVDPSGFLMGWIDNKPVSSISVVRYGEDFGFLGFYIVHPDHRGSGIGLKTWNAGMAHLEGRSVGLDGVVEQQDNYRKSGFEYIGRNIRYSGIPKLSSSHDASAIRALCAADFPAVFAMDQRCFGTPRDDFISAWCLNPELQSRRSLVCVGDGHLQGYGTIRQCRAGYKIGPLFCETASVAEMLFAALIATTPENSIVTIDVPASNPATERLAQSLGLNPVFETARMVKGSVPEVNWDEVFGLTSFELG
jgi:hypothetical protein